MILRLLRTRRWDLVGLAAAAGAIVAAWLLLSSHHPAVLRVSSAGVVPVPTLSSAAAQLAASSPAASPSIPDRSVSDPPASSTPTPSVRPEELTIPALGVIAQVEPAGVTAAGALELPPDPAEVSWWVGGASPGDQTGSVVIAGHVDSAASGLGALARLADLVPGDLVGVQGEGGSVTYRVTGRRQYLKSQLPAASIFARDVAPRLVLITCSGRFDRATGHYADNTVVYAVPVSSS